MDVSKAVSIQEGLIEIQKSISETIVSAKGEVTVVITGHLQIAELKIREDVPLSLAESLLKETINTGILQVSKKLSAAMMQFQQETQKRR